MIATPRPSKSNKPVSGSLKRLQEIADTLGVGIAAFHENAAQHLFHTAEDGTQWFLVSGPNGRPAVRQVGIAAGRSGHANEPIDEFVAKNLRTSQGLALAALIDGLLLTYVR